MWFIWAAKFKDSHLWRWESYLLRPNHYVYLHELVLGWKTETNFVTNIITFWVRMRLRLCDWCVRPRQRGRTYNVGCNVWFRTSVVSREVQPGGRALSYSACFGNLSLQSEGHATLWCWYHMTASQRDGSGHLSAEVKPACLRISL